MPSSKRKRDASGNFPAKRVKLEQMTLTPNQVDPPTGEDQGAWKWSLQRKATPNKENTESPFRRSSRVRRSVKTEDPAVTKYFDKHKKELKEVSGREGEEDEEEWTPEEEEKKETKNTKKNTRRKKSQEDEGEWTPEEEEKNKTKNTKKNTRRKKSQEDEEEWTPEEEEKNDTKNTKKNTRRKKSQEEEEEWTPEEEEKHETKNTKKNTRRKKIQEDEEDEQPAESTVRRVKKESVDSDEEENMEVKRKRNLEDNAKFLATLGIQAEVSKFGGLRKAKVGKPRTWKKVELPPRRPASLRLQRITPAGANLPDPPPPVWDNEPEHPRKPSGPLAMGEYTLHNTSDDDVSRLTEEMAKMATEKPTNHSLSDTSQDQFIKQLSKMQLIDFVKAVPNRIFSVAVHPSTTKVMALAGDKWGHLAFWDVARSEEGMCTFIPHSRPVNHIVSPYHDPARVYTASYDGTLRVTHLETATFHQVYATEDDDNIRLTRFDELSPSSLIVSQGDGCVAVVDTRTSGSSPDSLYQVHDRLVKCVNVHPVDKHYFLTATNGGEVNLWDLRKVNKKKPDCVESMPHSKSVDAAHFSPVNGHRILTTCYDNTLSIYDSSNMANIPKLRSVRHNNQTGRWLSNFRAEWHPQREDLFVIGSMNHPRQIELYSTEGRVVHTYLDLTSVCSLNAFHPTLNVLVGANSSGRMVAYR